MIVLWALLLKILIGVGIVVGVFYLILLVTAWI